MYNHTYSKQAHQGNITKTNQNRTVRHQNSVSKVTTDSSIPAVETNTIFKSNCHHKVHNCRTANKMKV